ncbi:TM1812 family CRISPR-associated protein [Sulfuracidifex metallicus]|uniref:TM1812 family CRISPR-associated protein n=1 Tax=Sulfuracidifex metallicus TaxID=47303 RepID=UPI002276B397|nr:TM1812 family CRISPR-associated protein [Sulfuracidifex metallicus]MCY0850354.1 hypothetical protein [Sulfuracidifex metallicus]
MYSLVYSPDERKVKLTCNDYQINGSVPEIFSRCFNIKKVICVDDSIDGCLKPNLREIYSEVQEPTIIVIPDKGKLSALMMSLSFMLESKVFFLDHETLKELDLTFKNVITAIKLMDDRLLGNLYPELRQALWYFRNGISFLAIKELENLKDSNDPLIKQVISSLGMPEGDDVKKVEWLISQYIRAGYYDKAISLGRELPIVYCMAKRGYGKLQFIEGDKKSVYMTCRRAVRKVLREEYPDFLDLRNYIMHTGLSGSFDIELKDGYIYLDEKRKNMIKEENVKDVARRVISLAKEIHAKAEEMISGE